MHIFRRQALILSVIASTTVLAFAVPKRSPQPSAGTPALWHDPVDIASRDLMYGAGGAANQPRGPFKFIKEDLSGTNPKLVISDSHGVKWKLKLGVEARPETAASRLVWAAGYFTDEDYFLPALKIDDVPPNLHRGANLIEPDGLTHNGRLKRSIKGEKDEGDWKWKENPFTGTREFNGLRVVMAVINNWDLKDVNNKILDRNGQQIYVVSDLGASFGSTGRSVTHADSKGNVGVYSESKFIASLTPAVVNFNFPTRPALINVFDVSDFVSRENMEWIGKNIPLADARWIGRILSRLSTRQIEEAFATAGFSPKETGGFTTTIQTRIAELRQL
jgi:hypothetical protein